MIKATVLYPNEEGKHFDFEYYTKKHVPMVKRLLGEACKKAEVEKGLSGAAPGSAPANTIIGYLYFDTIDDLQNSFGPNAEEIIGDVKNFTDINPVMQISEVIL
ncbi:MAG TPA: EthD family reductase [Parafilimonas sp.]|nr:EthD family reductase [Parafilimonas sp.]